MYLSKTQNVYDFKHVYLFCIGDSFLNYLDILQQTIHLINYQDTIISRSLLLALFFCMTFQWNETCLTFSATNTARVRKPTLVSETEEQLETEDMENFWHTSVGKFRFVLTELPQQFQFIHQLLKVCLKSD